jgi:DNA-binding transcriptional regulator YiaG
MTVDQLREIYAAHSDAELARKLRVSRQAISKWRAAGKVPKRRAESARRAAA